jgi:hypothetical protein
MRKFYVGPPWPAPITAYDYVFTLCPSDLAWEFLRRNPQYQRDYRLSRRGGLQTRRLRSGHQLIRIRRHTLRSITWGLHPFCRSGGAGSRSSDLLARQPRCSDPRGYLPPPIIRCGAPHLSACSQVRNKHHCRTFCGGKYHPPRLRERPHPALPWLPRIPRAGDHYILGPWNS